jgi:hypothetical protein
MGGRLKNRYRGFRGESSVATRGLRAEGAPWPHESEGLTMLVPVLLLVAVSVFFVVRVARTVARRAR